MNSHSSQTLHRGVVAAVCVVALLVEIPAHGQTASQTPVKLTPDQRREANRFVGLFRRTRTKPDNRANIFAGSQDGHVANQAWFHSPGHHTNMLANHARVGVGRTGRHFTQMFGR